MSLFGNDVVVPKDPNYDGAVLSAQHEQQVATLSYKISMLDEAFDKLKRESQEIIDRVSGKLIEIEVKQKEQYRQIQELRENNAFGGDSEFGQIKELLSLAGVIPSLGGVDSLFKDANGETINDQFVGEKLKMQQEGQTVSGEKSPIKGQIMQALNEMTPEQLEAISKLAV